MDDLLYGKDADSLSGGSFSVVSDRLSSGSPSSSTLGSPSSSSPRLSRVGYVDFKFAGCCYDCTLTVESLASLDRSLADGFFGLLERLSDGKMTFHDAVCVIAGGLLGGGHAKVLDSFYTYSLSEDKYLLSLIFTKASELLSYHLSNLE